MSSRSFTVMPHYLSPAQRLAATLGLGLMPLLVPLVLAFFPPLVGANIYITAGFWMLATSGLVRFSVPSLYLFNLYRRRLSEKLGVRSPLLALAFRRDSELAPAFWLNLVSTGLALLILATTYM